MLPTEVPVSRSGRMPTRSSSWITPICAKPRAAPPPNASPRRGARVSVTGGVGGVTPTGGAVSGGGGGVRAQPVSNRISAQSHA